VARELLARTLKGADIATVEQEYSNARSVYERTSQLHPKMRLDATQRASPLKEFELLWARIEECEADEQKSQSTRCWV
jgi:hypothetical protein